MIGVLCALMSEAECLIRHLKLKPLFQNSLFPLYTNGKIFLIVSGIGKMQAASALAYLYTVTGERPGTAWINIGVGGHPTREIGEGILAHQVIDEGSLRTFYPTFTWKNIIPTETVYTVDRVERSFSRQSVYDMEAAGFCSFAFKVTNSELIHCYKIISDNRKTPPEQDSHLIRGLIEAHLFAISELIHKVGSLQEEMFHWSSVSKKMAPFSEKWHFTKTQLFQLQRYLQMWEALSERVLELDELSHCKQAKDVLAFFDRKITECFL